MIKQILKQILKQRRSNTWILLELWLVFILVWYIIDYSFMMIYNRTLPRGYSMENTYRVLSSEIESEEDRASFELLKKKVENFPGVQKVLLSGRNDGVTPFNSGYSGRKLATDSTENANKISVQVKEITSQDYFEIFRIHSTAYQGKLGHLDFSNSASIALSRNLAEALFGENDPIGQTLYLNDEPMIVVDVVENQKNLDYELYGFYCLIPTDGQSITLPELAIRVTDEFSLEAFREQISSRIVSYHQVKNKKEVRNGTTTGFKMRTGLMIYFLLNIVLGVIGTFWFRNQARRGEIGLRMSMGSSRREILKHFLSEALLLLTLAAIPAMIIVAIILKLDIIEVVGLNNKQGLYLTENVWLRGAITVAITYVVLAIIVALSAWIPAYRASKLNPVDALSEE